MPHPLKNLTPEYLAERHRKQVLRQVWLPLIGSLVVALALAGLAVYGTVAGSSEVNRWGNISAVLLIIPNLFTSLISLVVLIVLIRLIGLLYRKMPGWLRAVQGFFKRVQKITRAIADRAAAPVISINTSAAKVRAVRKKLSL